MTIITHLLSQGVSREVAEELAARKAKSPNLRGITLKNRWISLCADKPFGFDEMVEAGRPPNAVSDVEFLRGRGKIYVPQLARFSNDPRALVASRGEVQKLCEQQGKGCDGLVKVKERPREEAPQGYTEGVQLSESVLNGLVRSELAGKTVTKRELELTKEKIRSNATPEWKKSKGR